MFAKSSWCMPGALDIRSSLFPTPAGGGLQAAVIEWVAGQLGQLWRCRQKNVQVWALVIAPCLVCW